MMRSVRVSLCALIVAAAGTTQVARAVTIQEIVTSGEVVPGTMSSTFYSFHRASINNMSPNPRIVFEARHGSDDGCLTNSVSTVWYANSTTPTLLSGSLSAVCEIGHIDDFRDRLVSNISDVGCVVVQRERGEQGVLAPSGPYYLVSTSDDDQIVSHGHPFFPAVGGKTCGSSDPKNPDENLYCLDGEEVFQLNDVGDLAFASTVFCGHISTEYPYLSCLTTDPKSPIASAQGLFRAMVPESPGNYHDLIETSGGMNAFAMNNDGLLAFRQRSTAANWPSVLRYNVVGSGYCPIADPACGELAADNDGPLVGWTINEDVRIHSSGRVIFDATKEHPSNSMIPPANSLWSVIEGSSPSAIVKPGDDSGLTYGTSPALPLYFSGQYTLAVDGYYGSAQPLWTSTIGRESKKDDVQVVFIDALGLGPSDEFDPGTLVDEGVFSWTPGQAIRTVARLGESVSDGTSITQLYFSPGSFDPWYDPQPPAISENGYVMFKAETTGSPSSAIALITKKTDGSGLARVVLRRGQTVTINGQSRSVTEFNFANEANRTEYMPGLQRLRTIGSPTTNERDDHAVIWVKHVPVGGGTEEASLIRLTDFSPNSCGCPGDANGDGLRNNGDLSVLLGVYGQNVTPCTAADFNGDGVVNGADLSILLGVFNQPCP